MRRAEREVTDMEEILRVLDECKVCRVGILDGDRIYVVPMNFGYVYEGQTLTLYFHGANEGHKYRAIALHPKVGFETDCEHGLITAENACGYGYAYASIIGSGTAQPVEDTEEKEKALAVLMKQQTGREFQFNEKQASSVAVLKITAEEFTCKEKKQK